MTVKVSSIDEILAALPDVQRAVRTEISARVTAGELIGAKEHKFFSRAMEFSPSKDKNAHSAKVSKQKSVA